MVLISAQEAKWPTAESILGKSLEVVAAKGLVKFKKTRKRFRQGQSSQPAPDAKKADGSSMQIEVVPPHIRVRFLLTKQNGNLA